MAGGGVRECWERGEVEKRNGALASPSPLFSLSSHAATPCPLLPPESPAKHHQGVAHRLG